MLPSVQQLLEHSFHSEGIKLAEVSSVLFSFLFTILISSRADGDPNGHSGYCSQKNPKNILFSDAIDSPVDVAITQLSVLYAFIIGSVLPHPADASFWQKIQDV